MTLGKKRGFISAVTTLALVATGIVASPAAFATEVEAPTTAAETIADTSQSEEEPSAGAQPVGAEAVADDPEPSPAAAESESQVSPEANEAVEESATEASPLAAATPVSDKGAANWDFKTSFREYVGSEHETLANGATIFENKLRWPLKEGQSYVKDVTTKLHFVGEVHWQKYNGILDVKISNPTIDFDNKQLLVDASTKGTLAGGGAKEYTQTALLNMADLNVQEQDGYVVISSLEPRITDMSKQLLGFYTGEVGQPFVAVVSSATADQENVPEPSLHALFPDVFPANGPARLTDPNEPVKDVHVPDAALAKCIRWELDLADEVPITNKVIQTLQSMQCIGKAKNEDAKIASLEGLEGAKNLTSLRLGWNKIADLTPLKALTKLHTLSVNNNAIESLEPLSNLSALQTVNVADNAIRTLPDLKKLENLGTIDASNNKISDISGLPIGSENLRVLKFNNNRISDISPLGANLYTRELYLNDNRIADVTPLKRYRAIQKMSIANNFIEDPSTFANWPAANQEWFRSLHIAGNRFTDWSSLDELGSKVKDRPEDPASALNPRTQAEALAADAEEQAQYDAARKAEEDAKRAAEEAKRAEEEAKRAAEAAATAAAQAQPEKKLYNAELHWAVRDSFTSYVTNPNLAAGKWILSDGAREKFIFPLPAGKTIERDRQIKSFEFVGGVRFFAHHGNLDLSIANPQVVKENEHWLLMADVASRPVPKNLFGAPPVPETAPAPPSKRVTLATLNGMTVKPEGTKATMTFTDVELTEEGAEAFGNFYGEGNRAMAPLSLVFTETNAPADNTTQPSTPATPVTPTQPSTPGTAGETGTAPTAPAQLTGELEWGIRASFREHLKKPLVNGKFELFGGATGEFVFPIADGKTMSHSDFAGGEFKGGVRFTGYNGLMDLTIANPAVVRDGENWKLYVDVASRPFAGPAGVRGAAFRSIPAADAALPLKRVHFANLSDMSLEHRNGSATVTFATAVLTEEGATAFGGFYREGNRQLDPVKIHARAFVPGTVSPAPVDKNNDKAQSGTSTTNSGVQPTAPKPQAPQPAPEKKVKQCTVDPHKMRVTSGSLNWGLRSSFTSYVRGSIAKGGWDLAGASWNGSSFNFPATGGVYNTATRTGTLYYSGSVHFHGHDGILDLNISNPTIEISGDTGYLYLSVTGSDMQGNKINIGRVHFANITFNGVYAGDGSLSFEGASASLTAEGAKAFAGFYSAGEALDALSSSASLTFATACDPATGDLIEYNAFGENIGVAGSSLANTGANTDNALALTMGLISISMILMAVGAQRRRALQ